MFKTLIFGCALLLFSGCASYGKISNERLTNDVSRGFYSDKTISEVQAAGSRKLSLVLSFSGGGTRAAALAYGVLEELRETRFSVRGEPRSLLDEVDVISSVSGGSFTAAYYGLNGEATFDDFEKEFLRKNFETPLVRGLLNPLAWFQSTGRTERAVKLYEESVFKGATFADMEGTGGPVILINATDLSYGVRFTFIQEYFNALCSDISSFPVARAVTASSAVPVIFHPVVMKNYNHCKQGKPAWLKEAAERFHDNADMSRVVERIKNYYDHHDRDYVHFVDGGITDNLGLRAIYEYVELGGGIQKLIRKTGNKGLDHLAVISVDAFIDPSRTMDQSNKQPSLEDVIGAVSDIQVNQQNVSTLHLMARNIKSWTDSLSTKQHMVESHFIQLGFQKIKQPEKRAYLNNIPTSFSLSDEQVNKLIAAGHELLRQNPEYQHLLKQLGRYKGVKVMARSPVE